MGRHKIRGSVSAQAGEPYRFILIFSMYSYLCQESWRELISRQVDEKLQSLGIEGASGSNVPHIFAPHARAASVRLYRRISLVQR